MKSLFIKNVPSELGKRLKVASIEGGISMRDMVLVAVGEYLDRIELSSMVKKHRKAISVKVNQETKEGQLIVQEDVEFKPIGEVNETLENVPPMKIEMEGGAIIEFHNNEGNAEVYTGCTIFSDEAIDEELLMENGVIVELDDTQPKDEPKTHDEVTEPVRFKKTW